jgi:uncharacterized protein (DUF736 family)
MSEQNTNTAMAPLTEVGAFWNKVGNSGAKFLSGSVEIQDKKFRAMIFKNNNKTSENQPDYRLLLADFSDDLKSPMQLQREAKANAPAEDRPAAPAKTAKAKSAPKAEVVENDDVPF